ncbi:uncharacterized protein LOC122070007 [Macadamia integrifolia]|uniref:uncharacterized protein LOC122070007 n=1 Tax=Macadamia integrifolia TaxID=60698 RepID=UPI001C4E4ACD|nr:uncharacterized protein LOC122070007 [Macadamia integrifolia]
MDETMIRCLQVQVLQGKKIENSFKASAYNFIAKEVNSNHPQHDKEKGKEFMKLRNMTWPLFENLRKLWMKITPQGNFLNRTEILRKDKGTNSKEARPYIHLVDHMEIGETDGSED